MTTLVRRLVTRVLRASDDAGFYVNDGRLRTEIVLPNPAVPPLAGRLGSKTAVLVFHAPDGRPVRRRVVRVPRGHTRVVDVARVRGLPPFGQVRVRYLFRARHARGGNRTLFHWHYAGGMTCVHEKKEPTPPRGLARGASLRPGQGYMTLFGVPAVSALDLHLVCLSQDRVPARVWLRAFAPGAGDVVAGPLDVSPRGATFTNLRELPGATPALLEGPIVMDAAPFAVSYYYFVHNREDGTWQAQHL